MRIVELDFERLPAQTLAVGVAGENGATEIRVDVRGVTEEYPDAFFVIVFRRADGEVYPPGVHLLAEGGALSYVLTGTETALSGLLMMEVSARQGDVVIKTRTYTMRIAESIDELPYPDAPEPGWIDQVVDAAARAEESAAEASQSEAEAKRAAQEASDAAAELVDVTTAWSNPQATAEMIPPDEPAALDVEVGEDSVSFDLKIPTPLPMYPTFAVDDAMNLMMYVVPEYTGANFRLTEDGNLEVLV